MKKILLLGLGRVGKVFTHLATDFSITVFDMQPPPASLASLGVTALEKTSLAALTPADLSPFDLVVNFLPVACNEQILPLVAETNCGYLDLATNEVDVPEQVAYRPYFSNRLFLANAGIAPGLDNLLVARLIKKGAKDIRLYLIEHVFSHDTGLSWCAEDAMATLNDRPISSIAGQIREHDNFSDPEQVSTSQGDFVVYRFFGEEILSLGQTFKTANISLKAGGNEIEAARQIFMSGSNQAILEATSEPDGIFGIKIVTEVGAAELFLKSSAQLWQAGLPGNYISFHTAYVAYTMLTTALKHNLQGFYFPETLPALVQAEILQKIKRQATVWDID